jgi:hypothetical protein
MRREGFARRGMKTNREAAISTPVLATAGALRSTANGLHDQSRATVTTLRTTERTAYAATMDISANQQRSVRSVPERQSTKC